MADPKVTPFTCAGVTGVVAPAGIKTLGETVSMLVLLLASVTVTPPVGAAVPKVTDKGVDWPGATVTFEGSAIAPSVDTNKLAVPLL